MRSGKRACGNELGLESKAAALGRLLWLIRHGQSGEGLDVWFCLQCLKWHAGRRPQPR